MSLLRPPRKKVQVFLSSNLLGNVFWVLKQKEKLLLKFMFYYFKHRHFSEQNVWWGEKTTKIRSYTFLRITIFVIYFRKYVIYLLPFMNRQSHALVRENFHGLSFYYNFKVCNVKIYFFSAISRVHYTWKKPFAGETT